MAPAYRTVPTATMRGASDRVRLERIGLVGLVARVTLNRPERRNASDPLSPVGSV